MYEKKIKISFHVPLSCLTSTTLPRKENKNEKIIYSYKTIKWYMRMGL
jgi:hypothetical protein